MRDLSWLIAAVLMAVSVQGLELRVNGETTPGWVDRDEAIEVTIDPIPEAAEGRLAVMLGELDATELFARRGEALRYRPELMPLPTGRTELVVYLVERSGDWRELGRTTLSVRTRGGFEKVDWAPRLDLQGKSRFVDERTPGPGGDTWEDATAQADVRLDLERSGWTIGNRLNVVGVTNVEEALRFGQKGEDADRADLSNYSVRIGRGSGFFELGHVMFGDQQHLISNFASRGAVARLPIGSRFYLVGGAMNGTSIVGWDNIFGLDRREHRVEAVGLGMEIFPDSPGRFQIEGTWLDGSLLPRDDFNQSAVTDAETSQGWAVRVRSSYERITLDLGYSTSEFDNPFDPLLAPEEGIVPVEKVTRDARFANITLGLVRNRPVTENVSASLDMTLRYEWVEPLYRSVAAFAQADQDQRGVDLLLSLGPLYLQAGYAESEDNLDDIPSILKTRTRNTNFNATLSLGALFPRVGRSWLLPNFNYSGTGVHQFGDSIPVNGGFSASHVPDQMSLNHNAGLQWQGNGWRFGYQINLTDQDNRQPGREANDFTSLNHGWSVGWTPHPRIDLGLDVSRERAASLAEDLIDRNLRYGLNLSWRMTDRLSLGANYSLTDSENEPRTREGEDSSLNAEVAYRFELGEEHGLSSQMFVRYFDQTNRQRDRLFGFNVDNSSSTINGGLSFSFY